MPEGRYSVVKATATYADTRRPWIREASRHVYCGHNACAVRLECRWTIDRRNHDGEHAQND